MVRSFVAIGGALLDLTIAVYAAGAEKIASAPTPPAAASASSSSPSRRLQKLTLDRRRMAWNKSLTSTS